MVSMPSSQSLSLSFNIISSDRNTGFLCAFDASSNNSKEPCSINKFFIFKYSRCTRFFSSTKSLSVLGCWPNVSPYKSEIIYNFLLYSISHFVIYNLIHQRIQNTPYLFKPKISTYLTIPLQFQSQWQHISYH